jgi:hypothetical protein
MDPRTLADYIAGQLDGGYGPGDAGFIDARVDDGVLFVTYTDDELGIETPFRLGLEVIA